MKNTDLRLIIAGVVKLEENNIIDREARRDLFERVGVKRIDRRNGNVWVRGLTGVVIDFYPEYLYFPE